MKILGEKRKFNYLILIPLVLLAVLTIFMVTDYYVLLKKQSAVF